MNYNTVATIRLRCVFESAGTMVQGAQRVPVAAIAAPKAFW